MNRRQFITAAAVAPAALLASDAPAPDLPLSVIAWQRLPEELQSAHYKGEWKELAAEITPAQNANELRWELCRRHLYPMVCFPELPIHKAKKPSLEANQRAALVQLIEAMSGPDLRAAWDILSLLSLHPLDEPARLTLAALQRKYLHPWGWEEGCDE